MGNDIELLKNMRESLKYDFHGLKTLRKIASKLLIYRDNLELSDPSWEKSVTEHITTLDSASTETEDLDLTDNYDELKSVEIAIHNARKELLELIEEKIIHISS